MVETRSTGFSGWFLLQLFSEEHKNGSSLQSSDSISVSFIVYFGETATHAYSTTYS